MTDLDHQQILPLPTSFTPPTPPVIIVNPHKCLSRQLTNKQKQCRNYRKIHSLCKRCYQRYLEKGILDTLLPIPSLIAISLEERKQTIKASILIQQWFRTLRRRRIQCYRGPAQKNRSICVNETDFYTCQSIQSIPELYFFSYSDQNQRVFGFDIRSIYKLLSYSIINPYNTCEIPKSVRLQIEYLWKHTNTQLQIISSKPLSKLKMYEQSVLSICNQYDQLGYYLDVNVILELTSKQIILFYKYAEDIWNYRAQHLTLDIKKKIVQDGIAFHIPIWMIRKYSPIKLKKLLIYEMARFVEGPSDIPNTKDDKVMGVLFILTALVQVSKKMYMAYPHLWQE